MSLRARMALAMMAVVLIVSAAFAFTVHRFIEVVEQQLIDTNVEHELAEFAAEFKGGAPLLDPPGQGMRRFAVPVGQVSLLPTALQGLGVGSHDDVMMDGIEYFAGRRDIPGYQLYMAADDEPVEAIESQIIGMAMAIGLAGLVLAGLVAVILSRLITRPVSELAQRVAALQPQQRGVRLHSHATEREVAVIASAFDGYLDQLDAFIEREQTFTEDASHELRTPLATMLSATQLLLADAGLPALAHERLLRIERAGERQQQLLEALLYLAREDAATPSEALAFDELVQELVEGIQPQLAGKPVQLQVQLEPLTLHAPPGMAASVVSNLLNNAAFYTEQGYIRVQLAGGCLTVEDSGSGIAPEDLARVFERRYRGPKSRGQGLGLYLVQRICQRLGWRLAVQSGAGGTTFSIQLTG